jgi:hypothetical protein
MRFVASLLAAGAAFVAPAAQAASTQTPEAELGRALEGRVAGQPVDCVNLRKIRSSRIIPDTAILFEAGNTVYVNRPRAGQNFLNRSTALITDTHSSRLCRIDVVRLVDSPGWTPSGSVFLGEFVPYRKAR